MLWQYILGINLHWIVLAMSVIILLAVGSDYNLLLVSRMKEEISAGINTGIIRAMGSTGKVVTTAGLVFALTMASMVVSDLRIIGQIGTTIGLGSGRAVWKVVDALRVRWPGDLPLRVVAASRRTEELVIEAGIELVQLDDVGTLDLAVDGADEVDGRLGLIKGGGGALLREKLVVAAARRFVVVAETD